VIQPKTDVWKLTVALWPHAIEAGVEPVRCDGYWGKDPRYYHAYEFLFRHIPTRACWWELCDRTPWMATYEREPTRRLIDSNPWPLVLPGKKACDVRLLDEQGREVGRIAVDREDLVDNPCPGIPHVGVPVWKAIVRGLKEPARQAAYEWVMGNEHVIAEEAMKEAGDGEIADELLVKVGRRLVKQMRATRQEERAA
jgi:hypothetical protein